MSTLDLLLLAVSLAMDCFTVSIVCGAILRRWRWGVILRTSLLFGLFQGLMPLLGWLAIHVFAARLESWGRWIAFALLLFIGGRMVVQSLRQTGDAAPVLHPHRLGTQLLLAVATSIDALAVGASLAVIGYSTAPMLLLPLAIIGLVSLLFSLVGHALGTRFGRVAVGRAGPELLGGIILVAIGLKILCTS